MAIKYDLKIQYDHDVESPRSWDNLGYFIQYRHYNSPQDRKGVLQSIVVQSYKEQPRNANEHIEKIKRLCKEQFNENIVLIVPISKYEHGNIEYYIGDYKKCSFDSGVCGFYIITKESLKKCYGTKRPHNKTLFKYIEGELEAYNKWVNGEIYYFTLEQIDTRIIDGKEFACREFVDSCSGFYDIESIREYLPDYFKDKDLQEFLR